MFLTIGIVFAAHWYISLFCQTFYLHRYSAHKMFTMNTFWERFFMILTWVGQGSSFLSPRAYAILHRMHHEYSDTELDPHSPQHSSNVFTMMWKTKTIYNNVLKWRVQPDDKFLGNYPEWPAFEKFADSWFSRVGWVVAYIAFYFTILPVSMYWLAVLLVPIHAVMGPIHGAIVNWSGHKYGYSNYENGDHSKNTLIMDFALLGELFQNNHHSFPQSANFAKKWYEIDPTYPVMKVLEWTRIIKMQPEPEPQRMGIPVGVNPIENLQKAKEQYQPLKPVVQAEAAQKETVNA